MRIKSSCPRVHRPSFCWGDSSQCHHHPRLSLLLDYIRYFSYPNAAHAKFGLLSPRGIASSHSTALPRFFWLISCVQCFRVFVIHRIFNVRTFLCVRVHTGGGAHRQRVSTTFFDSEKLSHIFLVRSGRDSNLCSWNILDLEADAQQDEPPRPLPGNGSDSTLSRADAVGQGGAVRIKSSCP